MSSNPSFLPSLANYLWTAVRRLRQLGWVYILSVACLWIGLTVAVLAGTYGRQELSYDAFHPSAESLYRLEYSPISGVMSEVNVQVNEGLASAVGRLDGVSHVTSIRQDVFKIRGHSRWYSVIFVDSSFAKMFDFGVTAEEFGSSSQASWMFVTQRMSEDLQIGPDDTRGSFGVVKEDRGWTGLQDNQSEVEIAVRRIIPDPPPNSSIHFDAIASRNLLEDLGVYGQRSSYVKIPKREDFEGVYRQIQALKGPFLRASGYPEQAEIILRPVKDQHFATGGKFHQLGDQRGGDWMEFGALMSVSVVLLVTCCVSYGTLGSVAILVRLKELGVRRVLGASRRHLQMQFFTEALVLTVVAAGGAIVTCFSLAPMIAANIGKKIWPFSQPTLDLGLFLLVTIVLALASGFYPASVAARVRLGMTFSSGTIGSRILVAVQCGLSVFVLSWMRVSNDQMEYLQKKDLGFAGQDLIAVSLGQLPRKAFMELSKVLVNQPGISSVSASDHCPGVSYGFGAWKRPEMDIKFDGLRGESGLELTMGLTLVDGRWLDAERDSPSGSVVVNQAFAKAAGVGVGSKLTGLDSFGSFGLYDPKVVGIVRDFHNGAVAWEIDPTVLALQRPGMGSKYLIVRAKPGQKSDVVRILRQIWDQMLPDQQFYSISVSDRLAYPLEQSREWVKLFDKIALMTCLLAIASLLGIVATERIRRSREVSIRRAIGASIIRVAISQLLWYAKPAAVGALLAVLVAVPALNFWLGHFPYHIFLTYDHFLWPTVGIMLAISVCVGWQVVQVCRVCPAEILKV